MSTPSRKVAGLDVSGSPSAEGSGAAGVVHQGDQGAQDDQEDQDAYVGGVRQHRDHTVGGIIDFLEEDVVEGTFKGEPGIEQGADDDTDEQGASLVIRARTMAMIGGSKAQKVAYTCMIFSLPFFLQNTNKKP